MNPTSLKLNQLGGVLRIAVMLFDSDGLRGSIIHLHIYLSLRHGISKGSTSPLTSSASIHANRSLPTSKFYL